MTRAKLITFEGEAGKRLKLYDENPIRIIRDFLEAVDSDGQQVFEFPPHVIKALAERLRLVVRPKPTEDEQEHGVERLNSLDEAFGGRIARKRNALEEEETNYGVAFDMYVARREPLKAPARHGTGFELATKKVAVERGMTIETVRRRYKKTRSRT